MQKIETIAAAPHPGLAKRALSVAEAASLSGISRSGLYIEIAAGRLRAVKARGRTLIRPQDLDKWLDSLPSVESRMA